MGDLGVSTQVTIPRPFTICVLRIFMLTAPVRVQYHDKVLCCARLWAEPPRKEHNSTSLGVGAVGTYEAPPKSARMDGVYTQSLGASPLAPYCSPAQKSPEATRDTKMMAYG